MQLCINVGCERTPTTAEKCNGFLKKKYKPIRLIVPLVNTLPRFRFVSWKGTINKLQEMSTKFWFLSGFLIEGVINYVLSYFFVKDKFK